MMRAAEVLELVVALVAKLEGPYKFYVIGAVITVLTMLLTRIVFKTFKWAFILLIMIAIVIGFFWGIVKLAGTA